MRKTLRGLIFIISLLFLLQNTLLANTGFYDYINKEEFIYQWEKADVEKVGGGKVYNLYLTSQVWQDLIWKHRVQIFYPDNLEHADTCTILNVGGEGDEKVDALGMMVAQSSGTVFCVLWNIPNQPLFEGKWEDGLIAYTWLKFMETGDESWPLHFPMAKSVIKCMDAVQEFSLSEGLTPVEKFVITGASKRGWTTWLAGASQDKRIIGIIPMVIDTLNLKEQLPHHIEVYGKPSEEIHDYTDAGILDKFQTEEGQRLMALVDPYSYRENIKIPKLIVNATNDRYWTLDALNFYWPGLEEPKWLLYVPNSGHGLEDILRVISTVTSFINSVAGNKPWPELKWEYKEGPRGLELQITSDIQPESLHLYKTHSDTKDFRDSTWSSTVIEGGDKVFVIDLPAPSAGFDAYFCEICYELYDKLFTLSTQIKIQGTE